MGDYVPKTLPTLTNAVSVHWNSASRTLLNTSIMWTLINVLMSNLAYSTIVNVPLNVDTPVIRL